MARDREYEKQARAYKFFIVQGGRAVSGWEYSEDARDELRAMKQEGRASADVKIVARSRLAKLGIDPGRPFHTGEPPAPASGFGKEKSQSDFERRIAWEKWAAANQRKLGHEALAAGHDLARIAYERELKRSLDILAARRASEKHERGDNPRTARSKPKAHGRKPEAGGSGIRVGAGLKKKIDGVLGRRK